VLSRLILSDTFFGIYNERKLIGMLWVIVLSWIQSLNDTSGRSDEESVVALQDNSTKQLVRQFMAQRLAQRAPLPSIEEIRRQLGWNLVERAASDGARRTDTKIA
jgi:predicted dithiol-disulfide oxidoreductase (DUF899 family)